MLGAVMGVARVYYLLHCDENARLLYDEQIISKLRNKHDMGIQTIARRKRFESSSVMSNKFSASPRRSHLFPNFSTHFIFPELMLCVQTIIMHGDRKILQTFCQGSDFLKLRRNDN